MDDTGAIPLLAAADEVRRTIEIHANTCLADREDVRRIVQAGQALNAAVLEYEQRLMEATGWSNPIRHLGLLPMYREGDEYLSVADSDVDAERFRVAAEYHVVVTDEELLANFVESEAETDPRTRVTRSGSCSRRTVGMSGNTRPSSPTRRCPGRHFARPWTDF
jgi:hypothetical protein